MTRFAGTGAGRRAPLLRYYGVTAPCRPGIDTATQSGQPVRNCDSGAKRKATVWAACRHHRAQQRRKDTQPKTRVEVSWENSRPEDCRELIPYHHRTPPSPDSSIALASAEQCRWATRDQTRIPDSQLVTRADDCSEHQPIASMSGRHDLGDYPRCARTTGDAAGRQPELGFTLTGPARQFQSSRRERGRRGDRHQLRGRALGERWVLSAQTHVAWNFGPTRGRSV